MTTSQGPSPNHGKMRGKVNDIGLDEDMQHSPIAHTNHRSGAAAQKPPLQRKPGAYENKPRKIKLLKDSSSERSDNI